VIVLKQLPLLIFQPQHNCLNYSQNSNTYNPDGKEKPCLLDRPGRFSLIAAFKFRVVHSTCPS